MNPNSGIFIHQQVKHLLKKGCQLRVISPVPYSPKFLRFNQKWKSYAEIPLFSTIDDVPVTYPRYAILPGRWFRNIACHSMYACIKKTMHNVIQEFQPNIIHAHMATADGYVGLLFKKKYKLPLICSFRGSDINIYPFYSRILKYFTKKVIAEADKLLSVSRNLKEVAATIAVPKKEVKVLYNGCDIASNSGESHRRVREELGILKNEQVVIFVGSIERDKGVFELLDAFGLLHKKYPDVHLILVGTGPEYKSLSNRIFRGSLKKKIHIVGRRPHNEVNIWLRAADIFTLPTYYEGFPNSVLEAMACGLPVIASNVGGISEAVEDGKSGILVKSRDVDSLYQALESVIADKSLAERMGRYGIKIIEQHFSWNSNAEQMMKLYREIGCAKS
jgi:glycosyltransferase involved in cell wall biosynthesis